MDKKKSATGKYREGTSFRLRPDTLEYIDKLSVHLGINKTAVIEQAVRTLARREKVTLQQPSLFESQRGKLTLDGGE